MNSIITNNSNVTKLGTVSPAVISQNWSETLGVDVGDEFRSIKQLEYWRCNETGFCWYTPAAAAGGGRLYSQLEKFNWYYMHEKWEFFFALGLIPPSKCVLEVGVGEGHFLSAAKAVGHLIQGVELNPEGARRARKKGFLIHEVTLAELALIEKKKFDVICSFQVLEHVPEPRSFIEDMLGLLKPGGRLILSVPNAAVMRTIDPNNENLLNQPPHHMGHWDESVFRALQNVLPIKMESVHREPLAEYHVDWMIKGFLRSKMSFIDKSLLRFIINRYTTWPLQWILKAGLNRFIPGHTLLVEFEYQPKS